MIRKIGLKIRILLYVKNHIFCVKTSIYVYPYNFGCGGSLFHTYETDIKTALEIFEAVHDVTFVFSLALE